MTVTVNMTVNSNSEHKSRLSWKKTTDFDEDASAIQEYETSTNRMIHTEGREVGAVVKHDNQCSLYRVHTDYIIRIISSYTNIFSWSQRLVGDDVVARILYNKICRKYNATVNEIC